MRYCMIGVALAMLVWAGCEKQTSPEPVDDPPRQTERAPARPTTQELLSGERQQLSLSPLPFIIRVPASWKVASLGSELGELHGPSPSGEVQIALASHAHRPLSAAQLEILELGARNELEATPKTVKLVQARNLGSLRILEKQSLVRAAPITPLAPGQDGIAPKEAFELRWTIRIFVPDGNQYRPYELTSLALTPEQYEADKDFLRSIIDSLQLDSAVGG